MSAIFINKQLQSNDIPVSDASAAAASEAAVVSSGASAGSCTAAKTAPVDAVVSGEVETRGSGLVSASEVGGSSSDSGSGTGSGSDSG